MAILDLKEKIEPFRKNATGYVKQLLSADHVVMSDGTTLQTEMNSLNSTIGTIKTAISSTIGANTNSTRVVSLLNGSIKIAGISKVATMTSNYIKVTDVAEIRKLFNIPSVDPKKITIISYNGDWDANNASFFAPSFQNNGTWWQYSTTKVSAATPTRLNIFIIYIA